MIVHTGITKRSILDIKSIYPISAIRYLGKYYCFIILLLFSGCVVKNTFKAPVVFEESPDQKRLTIFRANTLVGNNPGRYWPTDCSILAVPSNDKRIANLQLPRNGFPAFTFEMKSADTGSITFILALERGLFRRHPFFTDTTINLKDLDIGNNYWHLDYYYYFGNNSKRIPVLQLNKIEINKSTFPSRYPANPRQALIYNLSTNTLVYERKKRILSKQSVPQKIYKSILNNHKSINSLHL